MTTLVYFGTTRGLETLQFPISSGSVQDIPLPDAWIEISDSFGKLSPADPLFLFLRRTVKGIQCSWIGLYFSVNEIGYQRAGGFYGAGLWFSGAPVNGQEVLSSLLRAAEILRNGAIEQGAFQKRIAEIGSMLKPTVDSFRSLFNKISPATGGCTPSERESLAFIGAEGAGVVEVFEWAQRSSSATAFSKVIFGPPAQRPEGGRIPLERIFRSLALAIEFAHRARMTVLMDQVEHLQRQVTQIEANSRGLLERYRDLEQSNGELENVNRLMAQRCHDLEQRLQGSRQPPFQNPVNPPARMPVNLVRGEPPEVTTGSATVSTDRLVGVQQVNESLGGKAKLAKAPSVKRGAGSKYVYVIFIISLVVVTVLLIYAAIRK